ncbi:MAG: hypothetical protein AAB523_00290 [Patescibacteria group bacterium]
MNIVLGRHTWIIPIGLVVYWSVFVSLWGFWGWNDAVLFSEWWLFDTLGHACFGFGGTLTFLYLYRNYTLRGWFLFGGQKFLVMAIVTAVAFTGVLWEFFEGAWDLAHLDETSHVNAQAASLDTTIDILAETFASFLTMLGYVGINKLYEKKYPDESLQFEIEKLEALSSHLAREILTYKQETRRNIYRRIRRTLRQGLRNKE